MEQKQDVILSMLAKRNDDEEARPQKSTKVEVPNSIRVMYNIEFTETKERKEKIHIFLISKEDNLKSFILVRFILTIMSRMLVIHVPYLLLQSIRIRIHIVMLAMSILVKQTEEGVAF